MSEHKHTPGPWEFGENLGDILARGKHVVLILQSELHGAHMQIQPTCVPLEEALANRHLIRAAPDLLAVVENANALAPCPMYADAIAKAKGATNV